MYMKKFAQAYPDKLNATAVAQIPWGHNNEKAREREIDHL